MIRVKPNHIAVVPIDDPDKVGHIYIPDQAKDRTDQGIVKYVGRDVRDIRPLDYVLYPGYNGKLVYLEGEGRLIIMAEDSIVARVEADDIEHTEVKDLYIRTREGYTTITYEAVLSIIARSITEAPWFKDKTHWDVRQVSEKSKPNQHRDLKETRSYEFRK